MTEYEKDRAMWAEVIRHAIAIVRAVMKRYAIKSRLPDVE